VLEPTQGTINYMALVLSKWYCGTLILWYQPTLIVMCYSISGMHENEIRLPNRKKSVLLKFWHLLSRRCNICSYVQRQLNFCCLADCLAAFFQWFSTSKLFSAKAAKFGGWEVSVVYPMSPVPCFFSFYDIILVFFYTSSDISAMV